MAKTLAEVQDQMLAQKWEWYTVFLEGDQDSADDTNIAVEAYSEQDALDRVLIGYQMKGGKLSLLSGEAAIFKGRSQRFNFPTNGD